MAEEIQKTTEEPVEEQPKKKKKSFKEWYNEHPKTVFGIRVALWITFAGILPFSFIAWRYGIFQPESKIKLSGWGIIGIIIVIVVAITLASYIYKGMKQGIVKQCIGGFFKIILPLVILLLFVREIKSNIKLVEQALGCVILCEAVAIPINPFPSWLEKRRIEQGREQAETLSDIFWETFFRKKKDKD